MGNKNSKGFKIDEQFELVKNGFSHNDETKWFVFILEH
jgi:hypothetical protein